MRIKDFYKRLEEKEFFKNFKKENPDSFLISVFCFLSKSRNESDKISFNFYSPSKKKFFSSDYPFCEIVFLEEREIKEMPLSIENIGVDIADLWDIVEKLSKEKKPIKMICFLINGGWKIKVFYSDLFLKKLDLDKNGKILKVEDVDLKNSFFFKGN